MPHSWRRASCLVVTNKPPLGRSVHYPQAVYLCFTDYWTIDAGWEDCAIQRCVPQGPSLSWTSLWFFAICLQMLHTCIHNQSTACLHFFSFLGHFTSFSLWYMFWCSYEPLWSFNKKPTCWPCCKQWKVTDKLIFSLLGFWDIKILHKVDSNVFLCTNFTICILHLLVNKFPFSHFGNQHDSGVWFQNTHLYVGRFQKTCQS